MENEENDKKGRGKKIWRELRLPLRVSIPGWLVLFAFLGSLILGEGMIEFLALLLAVLLVIVWIAMFIGIPVFLEMSGKEVIFLWMLTISEVIIFVEVAKSWFHSVAMFFYINIWIIQAIFWAVVIALGIGYVVYKATSFSVNKAGTLAFGLAIILLIIFIPVFGLLSATYTKCYLAETLPIEEISDLPVLDENFTRTIPMKVADRYAIDACQFPQHRPKKPSDIVMVNGSPCWGYILVPDGWVNYFAIKSAGAILVDMTTVQKETMVHKIPFKYAPDQGIEDDIYWQIFQRNYWVDPERAMVVPYFNNGSWEYYLAVPYISYETHFTFPIWYRVPKWGGVFLVSSDGEIQDLTPLEARDLSILQGQKIFPEKLILEYIDSQRYWKAKNSWWDAAMNVWFSHEQDIEVTDVSEQGNKQPFLLNTEEGLKWVVCVEPWGEAHGIYRIYLIDARDPDASIEVKYYPKGAEIGPVKACDYVRKSNPLVDWSLFDVVEPIPITPGGKLLWEVRIVPEDGSGVSYVAFVDPQTGEVRSFREDSEIKNFLAGGSQLSVFSRNQSIVGSVEDVYSFVENGSTRWIVVLVLNNDTRVNCWGYVEYLSSSEIEKILALRPGTKVNIELTEEYLISKINILS
ncbi:hypothetical protein J7K24_00770 [bacterium]|nr:hypothetical protein [bacterium]